MKPIIAVILLLAALLFVPACKNLTPEQNGQLLNAGINIGMISTSEIKVSVLIDEDETELAVRVLHTAYGLDAEDAA